MPDREKVIRIIDELIFEAQKEPSWKAENALRCLKKELLKEQEAVVRCKDCKWWDKKPDSPYGYCHACKHGYRSEHWEIEIYRTYKGDWFCADGECKGGR